MVERAGPVSPAEPSSSVGSNGKHHRIEIVHESLLSHWPRLVRWRSQDTEGAQLRDELRQAAQIWEQHDRSDDLLWSGTAYREFQLWQERYPGGLTAIEEAFATAMRTKAHRRRRRRRMAVAAIITILVAVAAAIGALWRRSEAARRQAVAEARRAEASKLLALGRVELERDHTAALAYATASLELADQPVTRRFALEALSRGPAYFRLPEAGAPPAWAAFSPDERWLAVSYAASGEIWVWPRDGGEPIVLREAPRSTPDIFFFAPSSDLLVSAVAFGDDPGLRLWSLPEGRLARRLEAEPQWPSYAYGLIPLGFDRTGAKLFTLQTRGASGRILEWPVDGGPAKELGIFENKVSGRRSADAEGRWFAAGGGDGLRDAFIAPLEPGAVTRFRHVGHHDSELWFSDFDEEHQRLAVSDGDGTIVVWRLHDPRPEEPLFQLEGPSMVWGDLMFDDAGETLASGHEDGSVCLWDLAGPPAAEPLTVRFESGSDVKGLALQPSARWVAAVNDVGGSRVWPLVKRLPTLIQGHTDAVLSLAFAPDSLSLLSSGYDGVRSWPLRANGNGVTRVDLSADGSRLALDPAGRFLLRAGLMGGGAIQLIPLGEDSPEVVTIPDQGATALAISGDGRLAAWGGRMRSKRAVTVWNVETEEMHRLDVDPEKAISGLEFTPRGELLIVYGPPAYGGAATEHGGHVLRRWNLFDDSHEALLEEVERFDLSDDGRSLLALQEGRLVLHDLIEEGVVELLPVDAEAPFTKVVLDPSGEVAAVGTEEGLVLVMPASGGPAHLLFGHRREVNALAFSADGSRLATGDVEGVIRLWSLPDLSRPPLHTLPLDELLAKLRSLTNLRAVADPSSPTGWKLTIGPFPGWEEVPQW